jgi:hypothetical protein
MAAEGFGHLYWSPQVEEPPAKRLRPNSQLREASIEGQVPYATSYPSNDFSGTQASNDLYHFGSLDGSWTGLFEAPGQDNLPDADDMSWNFTLDTNRLQNSIYHSQYPQDQQYSYPDLVGNYGQPPLEDSGNGSQPIVSIIDFSEQKDEICFGMVRNLRVLCQV